MHVVKERVSNCMKYGKFSCGDYILLSFLIRFYCEQGSHFFELTKFQDFSRFFFSKFPGIFSLFLKYDFQVILNINMQTY